MYDVSYNRTYWRYKNTNSIWRGNTPHNKDFIFYGVYALGKPYYRHGNSIKEDYIRLVKDFSKKYKNDFEFVLGLSGGIDSEFCAEIFYTLGIPFKAISLRLFNGLNNFDIEYAIKFCKTRNIKHQIIDLNYEKLAKEILPKAIHDGEFSLSISQIALTYLFNYIADNEILINSGHNPDIIKNAVSLGPGWWDDSPNFIKYAIKNNKKFMTFTSIEPIFCHYANNIDTDQPGNKNNDFLYKEFPYLDRRTKQTGWETSTDESAKLTRLLLSYNNHRSKKFITWKINIANYLFNSGYSINDVKNYIS